jgi:hypothetical protein
MRAPLGAFAERIVRNGELEEFIEGLVGELRVPVSQLVLMAHKQSPAAKYLLSIGWTIQSTSCGCGGSYAWLDNNHRMMGCVCHHTESCYSSIRGDIPESRFG